MDEENKEILSIVLLVFLPIILFFASFLIGRYPIDPVDVIKTILCPIFPQLEVSQTITTIVFEIRLPRIIGAFVVGAALAILLSGLNVVTQIFAFVFGLISVSITYLISKSYKNGGILVLVLSGVAISAFFGALVSAVKFVADPDDKLPEIVYWLMGSLASITVDKLIMISVPIIIGVVVLMLLRWRINLLSMGDEEAQALGLNSSRTRLVVIAACTLLTSAAVSISGIIGWLGLVIPHMTRMIVGPDNKILIPASLSLGASFLLLIDNISRAVISIEIPIGILTAVIGVPIFLYLLRKGYSEWS